MRLPHPLILLLGGVLIAASLTWVLPAGAFDRQEDAATGRDVVVAGTYKRVDAAPVGPFAAFVAVPRGIVEAADVVAVILFVGGAWVVLDKLGTLTRLVTAFLARFRRGSLLAIPIVSLFFAAMGALENMQEEIIPLVPVLLLLARRLGVDAVVAVAMSAGAAMVGSAFGPTNPFQSGIALKLAQVPVGSGFWTRMALFAVAVIVWIAWTQWQAHRMRVEPEHGDADAAHATAFDVLVFAVLLAPMFLYVYGALAWDWGFNELSAGFFIGGMAVGVIGGLGLSRTAVTYIEGMQSLVGAAVLVGVARAISLVLADGRVIDTVLNGLATPLAGVSAMAAGLLMIPAHALIHVAVPSVSGQAVLTMPVFVPLSDLLGISRQVTVLAYQIGAGLTELITPTNGALMAILLAAGVSYGRWIRFALGGVVLAALVGIAGMVIL